MSTITRHAGRPIRALAGAALCAGLAAGCATGPVTQIHAQFDCEDGQKLAVVFDHLANSAILEIAKGKRAVLASRQPEAGVWYEGDGFELKGAGDTLTLSAPDRARTRCVQTR